MNSIRKINANTAKEIKAQNIDYNKVLNTAIDINLLKKAFADIQSAIKRLKKISLHSKKKLN